MKREVERNGPAAAATLAAGIGCLALGAATVLAAASPAAKDVLGLLPGVGPLGGKVLVAVAAWLAAWAICARRWRTRELDFDVILKVALLLVAGGLLGTFPPVFAGL